MISELVDFVLMIFVKCLLMVAVVAWGILTLMVGTVIVYHLINFLKTLIQGVV
jgi:hypothetical protein